MGNNQAKTAEEKHCLFDKKDRVAIITINRPPMNALARQTLLEIDQILDEVENDNDIRSVVLGGSGEKMFSAGADVSEFGNMGDKEEAEKNLLRMHALFNRIEAFPKPVIACLNGKALGGGNELQMACHLAVAGESVELGLPEVRLGIMPGYGGTQRLPRLIGRRRAMELILNGDRISAGKALEYGLVNRVVSDENVREEAFQWAVMLAGGPPLAIKGIIDSVVRGTDKKLEEGMAVERENMMKVSGTEDAIEGVSAFFTKRTPEFKGK